MFNEEEKRVISQEIAEMNAKTATEANWCRNIKAIRLIICKHDRVSWMTHEMNIIYLKTWWDI
jgi:hypothetical protein